MHTNVSHRLLIALEKRHAEHSLHGHGRAWFDRAWKTLTLDLGQWLIAHGPHEPGPPEEVIVEIDPVDLASRDSFPASDPPAWISRSPRSGR